ncbi:MAG: hypothetical protein LUG21_01875 [Clostridiales bacterium]|nr:hypothetical protein [Clostridiales bacterium]
MNLQKAEFTVKKVIEEKHGGKIEEFDTSVFKDLFKREDDNLEARTALEIKISEAKKAKNSSLLAELKNKREALKKEKKEIAASIKKATDENSYYNKLAKPYIDAVKLIKQAENYQQYEKIKELYENAKIRADEAEKLEAEKEKKLQMQQKAEKERLKAERARKKSEKKNDKNKTDNQ